MPTPAGHHHPRERQERSAHEPPAKLAIRPVDDRARHEQRSKHQRARDAADGPLQSADAQVEQRCLKYLEQAANPLVPLRTLLAHVWKDETLADVSEQELLSFLREHELVHVIEADDDADPEQAQTMAEAGFSQGPYIILKTRIPTKAEMAVLMQEQLGKMIIALERAMDEAVNSKDDEAQARIQELLERSQEFREKLGDAMK